MSNFGFGSIMDKFVSAKTGGAVVEGKPVSPKQKALLEELCSLTGEEFPTDFDSWNTERASIRIGRLLELKKKISNQTELASDKQINIIKEMIKFGLITVKIDSENLKKGEASEIISSLLNIYYDYKNKQATEGQQRYLKSLAAKAGITITDDELFNLTKDQAKELIEKFSQLNAIERDNVGERGGDLHALDVTAGKHQNLGTDQYDDLNKRERVMPNEPTLEMKQIYSLSAILGYQQDNLEEMTDRQINLLLNALIVAVKAKLTSEGDTDYVESRMSEILGVVSTVDKTVIEAEIESYKAGDSHLDDLSEDARIIIEAELAQQESTSTVDRIRDERGRYAKNDKIITY